MVIVCLLGGIWLMVGTVVGKRHPSSTEAHMEPQRCDGSMNLCSQSTCFREAMLQTSVQHHFNNFSHRLSMVHRIGWWENLQESPIFDGKNHGFRLRFSPTNQSNEWSSNWASLTASPSGSLRGCRRGCLRQKPQVQWSPVFCRAAHTLMIYISHGDKW